jgi:hypothetical protein
MARPLKILGFCDRIDLPDERVLVFGDTHGSSAWVRMLRDRGLPEALAAQPTPIRTALSVGDWGYWEQHRLQQWESLMRRCGIERSLITLGNHEDYGRIWNLALRSPVDHAVQIAERTWVLPTPFRFTIGGRNFLSFGGAASVDRESRSEGIDWWPDELPTEKQVSAAVEGGSADLMVTHDTVDGSGIAEVEDVLRANPMGWPQDALGYSAVSRERVTRVWKTTRPALLLHGHMHVRGSGLSTDGRRVEALSRDGMRGSVCLLDLTDDLTATDLDGEWLA